MKIVTGNCKRERSIFLVVDNASIAAEQYAQKNVVLLSTMDGEEKGGFVWNAPYDSLATMTLLLLSFKFL